MAVEPFLGTTAQRALIAVVTLQAVVVMTMVAIAFGKVETHIDTSSDPRYKTIPCYLALFGLAEFFELLMAFDALRLRNVIQLGGILIFHLSLIVFSSLQVHEARTALVFENDCTDYVGCDAPGTLWRQVRPFLIVAPCVISAAWLVMAFYVRKLYEEFGWAVFRAIGADPLKKTMYQWYQIMICLLKFDFFCFAGVTMQLLIIVLHRQSVEFGLTVAAIPVVLILLIICGIALQREISWLMTISMVLMLASETYFIYKLVRFYEPSSEAQYLSTRATLTVFTIVSFILNFLTFVVGLRCFSDFNKGLYAAKTQDVPIDGKRYSSAPGSEMKQSGPGAPLERSMSIE